MDQETSDLSFCVKELNNTFYNFLRGEMPARAKEFETMCIKAKNAQDIQAIVEFALADNYSIWFYPKGVYNEHIGWGLPTDQVCFNVSALWQHYPSSRIVDMGAGSGLFCLMFHDAGVPADKLLAIDKIKPSKQWKTTHQFWPIQHCDDFEVPIDDIFFLAWGGETKSRLTSYIERGGWCVVILGEDDDGCTFPADYLAENDEWHYISIYVDGLASFDAERLSISIRRRPTVHFFKYNFC